MYQEKSNLINPDTIVLIVYAIAVIFLLLLFVIVFFIAFQKRKNKLLLERLEAKQRFEKELANTQLEIQEQTFKNIAWELHDNVGQLLSVVSMQLNIMLNKAPDSIKEQIVDTKSVVSETVQEIRNLSKTLNHDVIQNNGLVRSLQIEVERFNRLKYLEATINIKGEEAYIKSEHEILIFRMYQECLSNVMKHSKAKKLNITLHYKKDKLEISAIDDGIGFDPLQKTESSGLQTIKGRAELLNAKYLLASEIGKGTNLTLIYPYPDESE